MGIPKRIDLGHNHSGISIAYTKRRRSLSVSGWYDTHVGIEGAELSLGEFLHRLGITAADCARALNEATAGG